MTLCRTTALTLAGLAVATIGLQAQQRGTARPAWRDIQGFNIVLVVGENQRSASATDDIPGGARRALNDMREFLPYKHYRVLDSQWTSCCSAEVLRVGSSIAGRLQGVSGGTGPGGATVLVPRVYSFNLHISDHSDATRIPVRFALRSEEGSGGARGGSQAKSSEGSLVARAADIRAELDTLSAQIQNLRARVEVGMAPQSELQQLQARHTTLERRLAETMNTLAGQGGGTAHRTIIDSSFTMDVGETVVVGTSRLGGDKALIALVTAVRRSTSSR